MKELFPYYSIGHFINQPNNPTAFEIIRFEDLKEEPNVDDIHKHTFYEVIWIEQGQSKQIINDQAYLISPQTLFFISPGQVHQFEEWQKVSGGSVFFTEEFYLLHQQDKNKLFELSFLDNLYTNPFLQLDTQSFSEIKQTIDLLYAEHGRKDSSLQIKQALLHILLTQIQRCVDSQTLVVPKKSLILYKKLTELIEQHFEENLFANDYAALLSITPHHLNHVAKMATGNTTTALIRARSVLEAKRLLTFSDNSVSEIAAQLGFYDSSYFAKIFKAETGISPIKFKKNISEKYRIR